MSNENRRVHERTHSEFPATLVAGNFLYSCVVADHSERGARLVFERPVFVRGPMELVVDELTSGRCRPVWRLERSMGVTFD